MGTPFKYQIAEVCIDSSDLCYEAELKVLNNELKKKGVDVKDVISVVPSVSPPGYLTAYYRKRVEEIQDRGRGNKPMETCKNLSDKVKLLKELVKDWHEGVLSDCSAMIIVSSIISPVELSGAEKRAAMAEILKIHNAGATYRPYFEGIKKGAHDNRNRPSRGHR